MSIRLPEYHPGQKGHSHGELFGELFVPANALSLTRGNPWGIIF